MAGPKDILGMSLGSLGRVESKIRDIGNRIDSVAKTTAAWADAMDTAAGIMSSSAADMGDKLEKAGLQADKFTGKLGKLKVGAKALGGIFDSLGKSLISLNASIIGLGVNLLISAVTRIYELKERWAKVTGMVNMKLGAMTPNIRTLTRESRAWQGTIRGLTDDFEMGAVMFTEYASTLETTGKHVKEFSKISLQLARGFDLGGKGAGELTKSFRAMGFSSREMTKEFGTMMGAAGLKGVDVNLQSVVKDLADAGDFMAEFGKSGTRALIQSTVYLKQFNIGLKDTQRFMEVFDTFDSAAEATARLNTIFGTTISSLDMMLEQDPAARIEKVRQQLLAQGRDYESMSRFERKALADTLKIGEKEIGFLLDRSKAHVSYVDFREKAAKKEVSFKDAQRKMQTQLQKTSQTLFAFGVAMDKITTAIANALRPLFEEIGLVKKGSDAWSGFGDIMSSATDAIVKMFKSLAKSREWIDLMRSLGKQLVKFGKWVKGLKSEDISNFFNSAISGVKTFMKWSGILIAFWVGGKILAMLANMTKMAGLMLGLRGGGAPGVDAPGAGGAGGMFGPAGKALSKVMTRRRAMAAVSSLDAGAVPGLTGFRATTTGKAMRGLGGGFKRLGGRVAGGGRAVGRFMAGGGLGGAMMGAGIGAVTGGGTTGGVAGGAIGGTLGMIAGPLGGAIGGAVGGWLGKHAGAALSDWKKSLKGAALGTTHLEDQMTKARKGIEKEEKKRSSIQRQMDAEEQGRRAQRDLESATLDLLARTRKHNIKVSDEQSKVVQEAAARALDFGVKIKGLSDKDLKMLAGPDGAAQATAKQLNALNRAMPKVHDAAAVAAEKIMDMAGAAAYEAKVRTARAKLEMQESTIKLQKESAMTDLRLLKDKKVSKLADKFAEEGFGGPTMIKFQKDSQKRFIEREKLEAKKKKAGDAWDTKFFNKDKKRLQKLNKQFTLDEKIHRITGPILNADRRLLEIKKKTIEFDVKALELQRVQAQVATMFTEEQKDIIASWGGAEGAAGALAMSGADLTPGKKKVLKDLAGLTRFMGKFEVPGGQHGGIVTRPMSMMVGEAGAEAIIPLKAMARGRGRQPAKFGGGAAKKLVNYAAGGGAGGGDGATKVVAVAGNVYLDGKLVGRHLLNDILENSTV